VNRRLDDYEKAAEWDVYVSAKVVKPNKDSQNKGKDGVWMDRIFLVRAIHGAQRPDIEKAALKAFRAAKDKVGNAVSEEMNKLE
jgi:hypothetical protein